MLLFQFPGVAEQWLSADDFRNFRAWSGHPDIEDVVSAARPNPVALTASLNIYRANLPPESLVADPAACRRCRSPTMGVWSSGDMALTEEQMTGSARPT